MRIPAERRNSEDVPKTSPTVHKDSEDVPHTSPNARRDSEDVRRRRPMGVRIQKIRSNSRGTNKG